MRSLVHLASAGFMTLTMCLDSLSDNGTWTNTASGLWGDAANWSGGAAADGADATAFFNAIDIASNTSVRLGAALTLGGIVFGDTSTNTPAGWILDDDSNAGHVLTLDGTAPTLTVEPLGSEQGTKKTVVVRAVLAGTNGLTKAGAGTLTLSRANTYRGETTVSDGTLQLDILSELPTAGLALWLDATQGVTTNSSGNTTVWADRSGNGRNATNPGSTGPTVAADINGRPSLRFTKSQSQYLVGSGPVGVANLTVFIVHKLTSVNAGGGNTYALIATDAWTDGGVSGRSVHINADIKFMYAVYSNNGNGTTSYTAGTVQIDEILDANGAYSLFRNGEQNGSNSTARPGWLKNLGAFRIGAWNASRYLDGSIGEILIYTNALGTAERQAVGVYLKRKWGISASAYPNANVLPATTTVSITNGASLALLNLDQTISALTGTAGGRVVLDGSLTVTGNLSTVYAGHVSGSGNLNKQGSGTLTLAGTNAYTGATAVTGGKLCFTNVTPASLQLSAGTGATLEYAVSQGVTLNHTKTDLSGAGKLLKTGLGKLTFGLGAGNTINWNFSSGALIDVQEGTLLGGGWNNNTWTTNHASLNVAQGALFSGIEANVSVPKLTGQGTVKTGYSGNYKSFTVGLDNESSSFGGGITDDDYGFAGNLSKIGTGSLTLAGTNTYTGHTAVDSGTLKISGRLYAAGANTAAVVTVRSGSVLELGSWGYGPQASLGLLATDPARLMISNGTVRVTGPSASTRSATVKGSATLDVAAGAYWNILAGDAAWAFDENAALLLTGAGNGSFAPSPNGAGGVLKTGTGKWTLTGTNTVNGPIDVQAGILQVANTRDAATPPAGAALWLDATRGTVTNSSGRVTLWVDLSGNERHAFNAASTGPTIAADINGQNTLRFTKSQSQYLACVGPGGLLNLNVFIVHKIASLPGPYALIATDAWGSDPVKGNAVHINDETTLNYAIYSDSTGFGTATLTAGTTRIDEVVDTNGDYALFLNGAPNGSDSGTRGGQRKNFGAFRIGAWAGSSTRYLDGSIGEILIYTNALSSSERQAAYAYLNAKWMIPGGTESSGAVTNLLATNAVVSVAQGATLDLSGQSQTLSELTGNGTVMNGLLNVTGTIAPGGTNHIGTLSVAQALLTGVLLMDVYTQTNDCLIVAGDLNLSGLNLRVVAPGSLPRDTEYVLATYTGTLTAPFLSADLPRAWMLRYTNNRQVRLVCQKGTLLCLH